MRSPARRRSLALLTAAAVSSGTLLALAAAGPALAATPTGSAQPDKSAAPATGAVGTAAAPAGTATTPAGAATPPTARPPAGVAGGAAAPTTTYLPAGATPTPPNGKAATGAATGRVKAHGGGKISTGAIVAAAIAALLALGCAAWGIARLRAYEPHWALSARHAMAEAGFRASATWAEFSDWIRLGR